MTHTLSLGFDFRKNNVNNFMQQLIGKAFYKNISSAVHIKGSEMLTHDTPCCLSSIIQLNMQRKFIRTVCDWTNHCELSYIVEIVIAYNDSRTVSCLFMTTEMYHIIQKCIQLSSLNDAAKLLDTNAEQLEEKYSYETLAQLCGAYDMMHGIESDSAVIKEMNAVLAESGGTK